MFVQREVQQGESKPDMTQVADQNLPAHNVGTDENLNCKRKAPSRSSVIDEEELKEMEDIAAEMAEVEIPIEREGAWVDWRCLWAFTGPGWLMSMAYLDPGNLESDLQAGAYAGYHLLWVLFWATVMGLALQVLAARLGVTTGLNLAQTCRKYYSRWQVRTLWVMTETAIIGSDIQEVIGSAIAFKILFDIPLWLGCLITATDTFSFLGLHYFGMRKLEAVFTTLIATMAACFWINYAQAPPDAGEVALGTVVPTVPSYSTVQAVGILGAVIMPHNIYLHSALVQSRKVDRTRPETVHTANKYNAIESSGALFFSFLINLAVVAVFARAFFVEACASNIDTNMACVPGSSQPDGWKSKDGTCTVNGASGYCQEIGLATAGDALQKTLGASAKYVWAVGLLAAGQASTMTGTYAGQFVMEGFLQIKVAPWLRVAFTRSLALGPAILVALSTEDHPSTSDTLDEWLNILQSIQLPFALLPVLHFTSSKQIMGEEFANGYVMRASMWAIAMLVIVTNVYLIFDFVTDKTNPVPHTWWFYSIVVLFGLAYFGFILTIVWDDMLLFRAWVMGNDMDASDEMEEKLVGNNDRSSMHV